MSSSSLSSTAGASTSSTSGAVAAADTPTASSSTSSQTTTGSSSAIGAAGSTSVAASTTVNPHVAEWRLNAADIQADLDSSKTIVRTRELGAGAPTGSMDDSVIITMVKNKLQADSELSSLKLDVQAHNGEVTLKGLAQSANQVGRAIALALDTDGVTKVSSDIKVGAQAK